MGHDSVYACMNALHAFDTGICSLASAVAGPWSPRICFIASQIIDHVDCGCAYCVGSQGQLLLQRMPAGGLEESPRSLQECRQGRQGA